MKKNAMKVAAAVVVLGMATSLTACATSTTAPAAEKTYAVSGDYTVSDYTSADQLANAEDTAAFCGDKPLTIGWAMGVGVSWLLTVDAIMAKELAAKCPNVTLIKTDAQGDPQKANSDINSLVAQGVDGIITNPLFGDTQIPAMKAAFAAGIPMVTYISNGGAVVGTDITANVPMYQIQNGVLWAEFMNRALKGKGTIAFLGGAPGQPSSLANLEALKAALVKYPGLTLIEPDMQPISNDAATARQVMSALLAKDGRIDGIITDNGTVSAPIIDAYEAAGMEPPALAVSASSNGLNCTWDAKKNFPFYSTDGNHMGSLVALRRVLSEITKVPFNEPDAISSWTVVDTLDGKDPVCDSTASPDADWSTSLTKAEMKALFK